MTTRLDSPDSAAAKRDGAWGRGHSFDAVSLLILIAILRVGLPTRLIFAPLGAAGTPATMLGLVAFVWWIYGRVVPGSGLARGRQPVRTALAIFAIAAIVSYILSFTGRFLLGNEVNNADRTLIGFVSTAGIVLLCADGISSIARLNTLLRWLFGLSGLLAFFGLIQFFTGFDIATVMSFPGLTENFDINDNLARSIFNRISVTAVHPIEFGVFLATMWPLAIHYALWSATRPQRAVRWVGVAMISVALMMTLSRSAILGVGIAGIIIIAPWSWRRRANAMALVILFTISMRLFVPGLVGTLRGLFLEIQGDSSFTARTDRLPAAFGLIHDSPWFGRGVGTLLPENLYPVLPLDNQLLATTIEMGIVGLVALVLVFVIGFATARGARRRAADRETKELGQALAASLAACFVSFVTFDAVSFPMVMGGLAFVLGSAGTLWRLTGEAQRQRASPR